MLALLGWQLGRGIALLHWPSTLSIKLHTLVVYIGDIHSLIHIACFSLRCHQCSGHDLLDVTAGIAMDKAHIIAGIPCGVCSQQMFSRQTAHLLAKHCTCWASATVRMQSVGTFVTLSFTGACTRGISTVPMCRNLKLERPSAPMWLPVVYLFHDVAPVLQTMRTGIYKHG